MVKITVSLKENESLDSALKIMILYMKNGYELESVKKVNYFTQKIFMKRS